MNENIDINKNEVIEPSSGIEEASMSLEEQAEALKMRVGSKIKNVESNISNDIEGATEEDKKDIDAAKSSASSKLFGLNNKLSKGLNDFLGK